MANNIKAAISYNDNSISIAVFNEIGGRPNILFDDVAYLAPHTIKKGFICEFDAVVETTKTLLKKASNFTKFNITKVYVTFDSTKDIEVNLAEINETILEDGVFDSNIWEKIKSTVTISQITDRYIYDVSYHSWKIDDKVYNELPTEQVFGKKLVIKTHVYKVNKTLHEQYENVLKQLNITPIWIKPAVSTLNSLSSSNKHTNAELFIYINDISTIFCHCYGNRITRMDNFQELGLEKLYVAIADQLNMDITYVKQILRDTWSYGNTLKDMELINGFNLNESSLKTIDGSTISSYIEEFANRIVECKNTCINFVREKYKTEFTKVTFIAKDALTAKIINLTQIHNDSKTTTYNQNYFIDGDESYNQLALMVNHILKQDQESNQSISCIDTETSKSLIGFFKGE